MEQSSKRVVVVLFLCLVMLVQGVKYWTSVDAVQKIVALNLMAYHSQGREAYDETIEKELAALDQVTLGEISIVEDKAQDELRVEVSYTLPLHVLFLSFEREQVAKARAPILGI